MQEKRGWWGGGGTKFLPHIREVLEGRVVRGGGEGQQKMCFPTLNNASIKHPILFPTEMEDVCVQQLDHRRL